MCFFFQLGSKKDQWPSVLKCLILKNQSERHSGVAYLDEDRASWWNNVGITVASQRLVDVYLGKGHVMLPKVSDGITMETDTPAPADPVSTTEDAVSTSDSQAQTAAPVFAPTPAVAVKPKKKSNRNNPLRHYKRRKKKSKIKRLKIKPLPPLYGKVASSTCSVVSLIKLVVNTNNC